MNMETFQWDYKIISAFAIILSIVAFVLVIFSWTCDSEMRRNKMKILKSVWQRRYLIFHVVSFVSLTIYVLLHWKMCISMQFFSKFDGNNILFVVWIISSFLIVYDVEGKGVKLTRHQLQKMRDEYETAIKLDSVSQQVAQQSIAINAPFNIEKEGNDNGPSD